MTRFSRSRCAGWLLACVLPPRDVDAAIGDLEEEYGLHARSIPAARVSRWYWSQIVRSIPVLLWASVRRGGVVATLATALGACGIQAAVELTTKSAMSNLFADGSPFPAVLTLAVTIPVLVVVSYSAARIRPGAATALTVVIVVAVVVQLVMPAGHGMSRANQIAALFLAPSAAFAGGVLFIRRRHANGN